MVIIKLLLPILAIITFSACDCIRMASGTIVDADTGKPLAHAKVYGGGMTMLDPPTRDDGRFYLSKITGCFCYHPVWLTVERAGYETKEFSTKGKNSKIIKLKKMAQ